MTGITPHYEFGCNTCKQHIFTINGTLSGSPVRGAFFNGELMVIKAKTLDRAREIAADGLLTTTNLLMEELLTRPMREAANEVFVEVAGRRSGAVELKDQTLSRMLADNIGKGKTRH